MPTKEQAVIEAEAAAAKKPSDEGKSPSEKEIENRVRENLRAEYARKEEVLQEKLTANEERIEELEEKERLSVSEKAELARLENNKDGLEDQIRILETDPKFRAYNEKIAREAKRSKSEAIIEAEHRVYVNLMEDYISEQADAEKMDAKELRKELNLILSDGKYADQNPFKRAKLGMRDRMSSKSLLAREEAIKKKELELRGGIEDGLTRPREQTLQDMKDKNDTIGRAKLLGL